MRRGRDVRDDDEVRETPAAVVWATAAGTAALPFLAVYAVMFIVHGSVRPVAPPDITSTTHGELLAGITALLLFIVAAVALLWLLSGRRRWPFALVQLGMLATAIDFLVDVTKGGRLISFVVAVASLVALGCAFLPSAWAYFGRGAPRLSRRRGRAAAEVQPADVEGAAPFAEAGEPARDPQSV